MAEDVIFTDENDEQDHYLVRLMVQVHVPKGTPVGEVLNDLLPPVGPMAGDGEATYEVLMVEAKRGHRQTETTASIHVIGPDGMGLEDLPAEVQEAIRKASENVLAELQGSDDDEPTTH